MSTHILVKAETGEVGVSTPVHLHVDDDEFETTLPAVNTLAAHVERHAPQDCEIRRFFDEGGTENASQCATDIELPIPYSPDDVRSLLLQFRKCLKDKTIAFLADDMEPQEQAADKGLIAEVRELKGIAQELLKSDSRADADTEVIEQPEE